MTGVKSFRADREGLNTRQIAQETGRDYKNVYDDVQRLCELIEAAFIYGSVARGEHHASSDIDVFLVGEILLSQLALPLSEAEKKLGRQVSTTIFDRKEFANRSKKRDHFVSKVLAGPKIFLVGDEARLKGLHAGT